MNDLRRARRRTDGGFTLIELLMVVVIISILAALSQPQLHRVLLKARAADVVGNMEVVKVAALSFQADSLRWPSDANRGQIPDGLEAYLPDGFSFTEELYVLDFDNWGGSPFNVGITMITTDQDLGLAVLDLLGKPVWNTGNKFSWVID